MRASRYLFSSHKYFLDSKHHNILLQTKDELGSLSQISSILSKNHIDMTYIKSRFSNAWTEKKKYGLDLSIQKQNPQIMQSLIKQLNSKGIAFQETPPIQVPWFPTKISDLNHVGKVLLDVKDEVNRDHPQFSDPEYRKRRDFIANVALDYQMGQKIARVPYTSEENQLWRSIYSKLRGLHRNSMSERYEKQIKKLQKQFLLKERIPQLDELSAYLKNKTGFQIKPTHGILSQREFLNCFAFKVFCCTQYLRHVKTPDYTPEPDIVHEIVGHVPMFADPAVAELSQQIGLLSLGASDAQIAQLGALYWFTLEFGVCQQNGGVKGYGAGIASSIGEIEHLISDKAKFKAFEPMIDCHSSYPIQTVQECYRVTKSFSQSLIDLENYGYSVEKATTTTFNFSSFEVEYDRNIEAIQFEDKGPKF